MYIVAQEKAQSWFKEVRDMTRKKYAEQKNRDFH
jgi:hypothetical protein